MSKRSTWTTITPLPTNLTRQDAVAFLQDYEAMIDVNPLVKERHQIPAPAHASPEEHSCIWYSITDKVDYLPGGIWTKDIAYTCAFRGLQDGMQTHCYAPLGTHIRDRWTIGGSMQGEEPQTPELGIGAPARGLYLREDVDLTCNFVMSGFVKKTIKKSHGDLVEKIRRKASGSAQHQHLRNQVGSSSLLSPGTLHHHGRAGEAPGSIHHARSFSDIEGNLRPLDQPSRDLRHVSKPLVAEME